VEGTLPRDQGKRSLIIGIRGDGLHRCNHWSDDLFKIFDIVQRVFEVSGHIMYGFDHCPQLSDGIHKLQNASRDTYSLRHVDVDILTGVFDEFGL
jgi:hypothetical protein